MGLFNLYEVKLLDSYKKKKSYEMHFYTSRDAVYYLYALESELFDKWGRLILPGYGSPNPLK